MPFDLLGQLEHTGHARVNGLWQPQQLWGVREEALRLWQWQLSGNNAHLANVGADPHGCELRLSKDLPQIWSLLTSRKLAAVVAAASGWRRFRPLHFGILCKKSGAPMTGWHRDKDVIPSDAPILTCWIPLTPVKANSGLHYAEGTALIDAKQGCLNEGQSLEELLASCGQPFTNTPDFQPGDLDLHNGLVWHCGFPNRMAWQRLALAACYIPEGARLDPNPEGFNPSRGSTLRNRIVELYFPHLKPGELLVGDAHPLLEPN